MRSCMQRDSRLQLSDGLCLRRGSLFQLGNSLSMTSEDSVMV